MSETQHDNWKTSDPRGDAAHARATAGYEAAADAADDALVRHEAAIVEILDAVANEAANAYEAATGESVCVDEMECVPAVAALMPAYEEVVRLLRARAKDNERNETC